MVWYDAREVNRIHYWCSVGTGKAQPFQWETSHAHIIYVGDVTELKFIMVLKGIFLLTKLSQLEIAIKQHFKQCKNDYFVKMDLSTASK